MSTIAPHTIWSMGHVCMKKVFLFVKMTFFPSLLIFTMRPKVQLTRLNVEYHWKERAKIRTQLDDLKKPRVIPRKKPPANFSFKHVAFDLPPPTPLVPSCPKSNYFPSSTSKDSPLGFERFIRRNPLIYALILPHSHIFSFLSPLSHLSPLLSLIS